MKRLGVVLLVIGLLIFGCTAPPATTTKTPAGATGAQTGTPAGTQGGTQGGGDASGQQTTGSGGTGTNGSSAGTGGSDLLGKTYDQLLGLGVPLQCDITTTSNGKTTKSKIYVQGKDAMRSETDVSQPGSTCTKMVTIVKGDIAYIGCMNGEIFPSDASASNPFAGCKWMEMKANKSTTSVTASIGAEAPDYTNIPPAQINCVPWIYDASKFEVVGKSCNIQDIMKSYSTGGYPGG